MLVRHAEGASRAPQAAVGATPAPFDEEVEAAVGLGRRGSAGDRFDDSDPMRTEFRCRKRCPLATLQDLAEAIAAGGRVSEAKGRIAPGVAASSGQGIRRAAGDGIGAAYFTVARVEKSKSSATATVKGKLD